MVFTENQVSFAFENGVYLHDQMTNNEIKYAIDTLSELLVQHRVDKNNDETKIGAYCKSIIDVLISLDFICEISLADELKKSC